MPARKHKTHDRKRILTLGQGLAVLALQCLPGVSYGAETPAASSTQSLSSAGRPGVLGLDDAELPAFGRVAEHDRRTVGFDSSYYFYDSEAKKSQPFYPSIGTRLKGGRQTLWLEGEWNVTAQVIVNPKASQFTVEMPQGYVATSRLLGPVQLSVGRRLEHWNHLDEKWGMGLWQPRFRWDYLRPEPVAFTGAYVNVTEKYFQLAAMGSPVFVPDRGVSIDAQIGSISSSSPWFISPPSQILVLNKPTPVNYQLVVPPMAEIVLRPSLSLMARAGQENEGPWASVAYSYKPMNQLLLGYDGKDKLSEVRDGSVVSAQVYPRVLNHHLTSVEAGCNGQVFRGWVSGLLERPVRDNTPSSWTTQEVADALSMSASAEWTFARPAGSFGVPSRLDLSVLRVVGGYAADGGPFSTGSGSVFDSRYPFQTAVSLGLESSLAPLGGFARRVSGSWRLLQDLGNSGQIVSAELRVRPSPGLMVAVGADVLGSDSAAGSGVTGPDFIGRYRANDRVHAGVSYAF